MSGIDGLLAQARARLARVDPIRALQIHESGGLLVDIRPAAQRAAFGEIPGAIVVERNNLEWRLDPHGADRLVEAEDPARPVVVICQEGYASSLAAVSLLDVGRFGATDLDGGYAAWKAAGLPTLPATMP